MGFRREISETRQATDSISRSRSRKGGIKGHVLCRPASPLLMSTVTESARLQAKGLSKIISLPCKQRASTKNNFIWSDEAERICLDGILGTKNQNRIIPHAYKRTLQRTMRGKCLKGTCTLLRGANEEQKIVHTEALLVCNEAGTSLKGASVELWKKRLKSPWPWSSSWRV